MVDDLSTLYADLIGGISGGTADNEEQPERKPGATSNPLDIWDAGDDDYVIPPREWLLGTSFCKKFLSSVIADGGVGKTAVRVAQLLSLALGRSLTGEHLFRRAKVLIVSLEDDRDELRRRVYAVLRHWSLTPADVKGWLFLSAPKGIRLAEMREGSPATSALLGHLDDATTLHGLDAISLDPFVKTHALSENDNTAMDYVCTLLTKFGIDRNIAVDTPHHTRKGPGVAGDADRGRGASSMKDAARLVNTLTPMTEDEATAFGVPEEERRSLIRMDSGKMNLAPPAVATWFRLVGVPLGNGAGIYPAGDNVQTIEPWFPPLIWADAPPAVLNRILDEIDMGLPGPTPSDPRRQYTNSASGAERDAALIFAKHIPGKPAAQARQIMAAWIKTGLLVSADYLDSKVRKQRKGLTVNHTLRPTE